MSTFEYLVHIFYFTHKFFKLPPIGIILKILANLLIGAEIKHRIGDQMGALIGIETETRDDFFTI